MKYLRLSALAILPMAFFGLVLRPVAAQAFSPEDVTAQVATFIGNNLLTSAVATTDTLSWTVKSVFKKKVEFQKKIEVDGEATFHDKAYLDQLGKVKTLKITGNGNIGNDSDDVITIEGKIKRDDGKVYVKDGLRVTGDFDLDTASVDSEEIKNESLLSKDILDGKIQGKDLKDGTLTADKLASNYAKGSEQIIIISPEATDAASGQALELAVEGISDSSAAKPYVVIVEPGIYDLGTGSLGIPDYVHIIGSGEGVTTILSDINTTAVIEPGNESSLRNLTVKNISETASEMYGITTTGTFRAEYVTISIDGGSSTAQQTGFFNDSGSVSTLSHITIEVLDSPTHSRGITNSATLNCYSCRVTVDTDAVIRGFWNTAGTANFYDSKILATDTGGAGGSTTKGVYIFGGTVNIFNSIVEGTAGGSTNYGVYNDGSSSGGLTIERSTLIGDTNGAYLDNSNMTFDAANSQLDGGMNNNASATVACVGAYDGSYAAVNASCL